MITYNDSFKNKILDAVTPLTEGGRIDLMATDNTVLGTVPVPADAFGAAGGGSASTSVSIDIAITTAGTASKFRIYNSDNTSYREGVVATSGADMNFSAVAFNVGDVARIQNWTMTVLNS